MTDPGPGPESGAAVRAASAEGVRAGIDVRRGDAFRLFTSVWAGPGEVLAVLGPNGAGKSTLLRALAGLTPVTGGNIELQGRYVDDPSQGIFVPPEERRIGVVFQDYRLFPHLRVEDNVAFAARSRGARRPDSRRSAREVLERLDLAELAARKPHQLSGGQAQRVALARALAGDPVMLLLDEPMAALDARTRLEVRDELQRHIRGFAGPTVLVTHDPLDALVLADRIQVIEGGRTTQRGTAAEVARQPESEYVARLFGLNLLEGHADRSGRVRLAAGGTMVIAPGGPVGEVRLAVPPSAISLHAERPGAGSPRNVWPGVVRSVEMLLDRVRVDVDGAPPALVDVTPAAVAELGLRPGSEVWLSLKATEIEAYPAHV